MMPRHIVNRTPVDGFSNADNAQHQSPLRAGSRLRGFGVWCVITFAVMSAVVGYRFHQTSKQLAEMSVALDRALADEQTLVGRLSYTSAALRTTENELQRSTEERDAHGRTIDSLSARLADQADQHQRNRLKCYQSLHAFGSTVIADPRLARHMLTKAVKFANESGADAKPSQKLLNNLPELAAIPTSVSIQVVSSSGAGPETIVELAITDPTGSSPAGLQRGDFEVYDVDHRLHAVAVEESALAGSAQDILVLLDKSISTEGPPNRAAISAASAFVEAVANPARIQVAAFSDDVTPLSPLSTDAELHKLAIAQLTPSGGTSMYRAILWSVDKLKSRKPPRCFVLFTDGNDSRNQETIEQAIAACHTHEIPIHVVALVSRDTNEKVLRRLATETNGMYLPVTDPSQLTKRFQEVARSLQRPIYRFRLLESYDPSTLTLQVGRGTPIAIHPNGVAQPATLPHVLPVDEH